MCKIQKIADYLIFRGEELVPLNIEEIKTIEAFYDVKLPQTYKEFLLLMGKDAGKYMLGTSAFYGDIFELQEWGFELYRENGVENIPADAFTFWMHQGYQAVFFRTSEGDDPPVYYYIEGSAENKFVLKEKSLSDFFYKMLPFSYFDFNENEFIKICS